MLSKTEEKKIIEKIKNPEEFAVKERLDKYLQLLEKSCSDFVDVKNAYIKACSELKKVFVYTDKILKYNNDIALSELEFLFTQGINDNLEHYKNPQRPTFMDADYNEALKDKEMCRNPEYILAVTERQKLVDMIPKEADDIYQTMTEYTSFLDVYIPKMAHYYGFITGNTAFKKAITDYEPDYDLTEKYKEWLSIYLDLNLE